MLWTKLKQQSVDTTETTLFGPNKNANLWTPKPVRVDTTETPFCGHNGNPLLWTQQKPYSVELKTYSVDRPETPFCGQNDVHIN